MIQELVFLALSLLLLVSSAMSLRIQNKVQKHLKDDTDMEHVMGLSSGYVSSAKNASTIVMILAIAGIVYSAYALAPKGAKKQLQSYVEEMG